MSDTRPPSEVELKYALEIYGNCDLLTRIINEVTRLRAQQSTVVTVDGVTYNLPIQEENKLLENEIRRLRAECEKAAEYLESERPPDARLRKNSLQERLAKASKGEL